MTVRAMSNGCLVEGSSVVERNFLRVHLHPRGMGDIRIPPKRAAALELRPDEELVVIDPEGGQVADLFAVDPAEPTRRFSSKYTMRQTGRLRVSTGDSLYATDGRPMLTIEDDDCGVHDLLFAPCNDWILDEYGQTGERGCRENLTEAFAPWDVAEHLIQEPLNVFMRTTVTDHDFVDVRTPVSEPGDALTVRAVDDVVVGVSACAPEATVNAGEASPIDLQIPPGSEATTNF